MKETGRKRALEAEFSAIIAARYDKAIRVCYGTEGLTPDDANMVETIRQAFAAEALPELVSAAYRMLGIPENSVHVRVHLDPDGMGFKGPNIVCRINAPDTADNALDLRMLRGQTCDLYSAQMEIADSPQHDMFGAFDEMVEQAEASGGDAPEASGGDAPVFNPGAGENLFYVIDPDGRKAHEEPMVHSEAEELMGELMFEAPPEHSTGWKILAACDVDYAELFDAPEATEGEPEPVTEGAPVEPTYEPEPGSAAPAIAAATLTEDQRTAAEMLREGVDPRDIAKQLGITPVTLKRWNKLEAFILAATPEE
jgi:hypothetical protein